QGGFNGSLGALGATQAVSLISVITKVVAPGEWFVTKQPNPFQQNIFNPFVGFMGMGGGMFGMGGFVGGQQGLAGGAQGAPLNEGGNLDIQLANTIEFFPPALAIIVRGPSRVHTSIYGGIIGGKVKRVEAAKFDADQKGLDMVGPNGKIQVANAAGAGKNKNQPKVVQPDPKKPIGELDP